MKSVWKGCVVLFLAIGLMSQAPFAQTDAKPRKSNAARVTAADIQALKDAIAAQQAQLQQQQQQIQQLQDALQRRDQAVQQAQSTATDAQSKASAAQATATQQQDTVATLKSDVTDLKTGMASTVQTLQETQKTVTESPTTIHFKGVTLTPGGFLAAEFVRRSRALASDINTPFNSLTMPGASQSELSEFFGSGRQSRISLLAEGKLSMAKLSGYYEADFLSSAATSNNNQSNSYGLRQRQVWGQAAFDNGWAFTGGQMWSLMTETKHGLDNRSEALPMTIDANYNVGFTWARQYALRLTKNFGNVAWFGVSMENSQATVTTHNNASNFLVGSAGASGGLYNQTITTCTTSATGVTTCSPTASYSFNPSPDIIVKLAFEPGFGHYEVFGVYSRFRDRVFPCEDLAAGTACGPNAAVAPNAFLAFNNSKNGGGFGANARWSFANKHFDFGLHGFTGEGVGRYGSGGLPDASVHASGELDLVREYQGLGTLEWHAPKLDVYVNAGIEYADRTFDFDPTTGKYVGYGAGGPRALGGGFANSGCYAETLPANGTGFLPGGLGSCTADTRSLVEGTVGFWYKVYNGPKGRIQWGPQFSYVNRDTWSGVGGEPHGLDGMVFTSFRYYLP
jgi:hypothetical protein